MRAVVAQGAVQSLLRALSSGDDAVVEAAARSLKLIYRVRVAPPGACLKRDPHRCGAWRLPEASMACLKIQWPA